MEQSDAVGTFVPKLVDGVHVFALPGDEWAMGTARGEYLRLDAQAKQSVERIDGIRSLADIVRALSEAGLLISFRHLRETVEALGAMGALANTREELEACGLWRAPPRAAVMMRMLFGGISLHATIIGRRLATFFHWLRGVRIGAVGWASHIALCAAACAYLFAKGRAINEPLLVADSYALGVLFAYIGVLLALCVRELARLFVLVGHGVSIEAAGLRLRLLLIPAPSIDDRHILRAGRGAMRELACAGLAGPFIALAAVMLRWKVAFLPDWLAALQLVGWGAATAAWANSCPFVPSDLGRLIDETRADGKGRLHAFAYLRHRLIRRQGRHDFFVGESWHIAVAVVSVAWIYAGFHLSVTALSAVLPAAARLAADELSTLDRLAIGGVLLLVACTVVATIVAFVAMLAQLVVSALPRHSARAALRVTDGSAARAALASSALFSNLGEAALTALAQAAKTLEFKRKREIVRQGDPGDAFYVIISGFADVVQVADSGVELVVATLGPGDGFGEMALLDRAPRNATVRTNTALTALMISQTDFAAALGSSGVPVERVTALLRATSALRRSDIFQQLPPSLMLRIIGRCERKPMVAGEVVVREGDKGEHFYIIESGAVTVEQGGAQQASLGAGEVFGEIALLNDSPRNATVSCRQDCVLLLLDRESFRKLILDDFSVGLNLERKAASRLAVGIA